MKWRGLPYIVLAIAVLITLAVVLLRAHSVWDSLPWPAGKYTEPTIIERTAP